MPKLILAILALILTPVACWAETPKDSWENVKQLQPGHKIKVVDKSLKSWDGRLVSTSDEAITIREKSNQQEITVERANVLRVADLQCSNRVINAVIGFVAGALLYAAANKGSGDAEHALFIAMMGGVGAGVGAAIPHPRPTIYKIKRSPEMVKSDAQK